KVEVVNLSLGGPGDAHDPLSREVDALTAEGILVCVAAGNSGPGPSTIGSPGCAAGAITVGAIDQDRRITDYSSRGPVAGLRAHSERRRPRAGSRRRGRGRRGCREGAQGAGLAAFAGRAHDELVVACHGEERDRAEVVLERTPREIERNERKDDRADRNAAPEAPEHNEERDERNGRKGSVDGARQERERAVEP